MITMSGARLSRIVSMAVPAMLALSAQAVARGRFTLGIGLSHQVVIEGMLGLSFAKPYSHMREYLAVLAPLIRSGSAQYAGEEYRVGANVSVPGAKPCPILVAALAPKMLALTGREADGTITWMTGPRTRAGATIVRRARWIRVREPRCAIRAASPTWCARIANARSARRASRIAISSRPRMARLTDHVIARIARHRRGASGKPSSKLASGASRTSSRTASGRASSSSVSGIRSGSVARWISLGRNSLACNSRGTSALANNRGRSSLAMSVRASSPGRSSRATKRRARTATLRRRRSGRNVGHAAATTSSPTGTRHQFKDAGGAGVRPIRSVVTPRSGGVSVR